MAWVYLVLAGFCEIGWPIGLKIVWTETGARPLWLIFAIVCMGISGAFLLMAQRVIPMGTACAMSRATRLAVNSPIGTGCSMGSSSAATTPSASMRFPITSPPDRMEK